VTGPRRRSPLAAVAAVDEALFDWSTRRHHPVLDRMMPALSRAADHGLLWLCLAALMAASGRPELRRAAVRAIVSLAVASATVNGIAKIAIRRTRPPLDTIPVLRRVRRLPVTTSFPSGHASSAAAFVVGAAREAPGVAAPLGVLAAGVGLSRVWTGAHFPADVLVGAALGAAVGRALPSATPSTLWRRRRHGRAGSDSSLVAKHPEGDSPREERQPVRGQPEG
jgi:membrane-associated phospholipid phosphatase